MATARSRREILGLLAGLGVGTLLLPNLIPITEDGAGSEKARSLARGRLLDKFGQPAGAILEVVGTDKFSFIVTVAGKLYTVPMEKMTIVEGYPWKEVITDKRLGVRLDKWQYADRVRLVGAENVRVAGATEEIGDRASNFERMLSAAEKQSLGTLVVFNPTFPRDDSYYIDKLEALVRNHPGAMIQLGNEPDNTAPGSIFWRGTRESYAHFVAVSINKVRAIDPNREIVMAGLVMPETNEELYAWSFVETRDPHLLWGVHAYNSVETVQRKMGGVTAGLAKQGILRPRLVVSEMGVYTEGSEADNLLAMTKEAYRLGAERIYYHEYLNWEGFGMVAPDWSRLTPLFWKTAAAVRMGWQW